MPIIQLYFSRKYFHFRDVLVRMEIVDGEWRFVQGEIIDL